MASIRLRLKEILIERDISVTAFAAQSNLNYRTVLDITRNNYSKIGLDVIAKICDSLNIVPGDLFVYDPGEKK